MGPVSSQGSLLEGGWRVRVRVREGDVTTEVGVRGILGDATQLSLKMEEQATSQRMQVPSRS